MSNLIWKNHSGNACPSCLALAEQVHTKEQWDTYGVIPKDHLLYCREACSCTMEETDAEAMSPEAFAMVPLRHSLEDAGSASGRVRPLHITGDTPEPPIGGNMQETEYTLAATAKATAEGFDILAINEGEATGHGIRFSAAVLQEAMPLYNDIPVFIDHSQGGQSIRNLAGTLHTPQWNDGERGIQAKLHASGPAKEVLLAVREAAKTNPAIMKAVGFSTVLFVNHTNKGDVTKITRVKSCDVVINPARGGKFLSALDNSNAQKKENTMSEQTQEAEAKLQETAAQVKALQTALLDEALKASGLPEASQKVVKKSLQSRDDLTPAVIADAIKDKREELSAINPNIQGPSRAQFSEMVDSGDQFRLAVEDLFGLEREANERNIKTRRLSGIREAYTLATGDIDFMGGYHREFALVTANFPGLVANIQNKMLLKAWDQLKPVYGWWEKIVTVEHFSNLQDVAWLRTGTIASLPTVLERGEYLELPIGDNKETSTWQKFGGYVPLTLEAVLRDDLRAFKRMPHEIALAGMRNISEQVAEIFTTASGAGPTLADTGALFNATAVTTAGGHANLLTTALGTDFTAWDAIAAAVYNQPLLVKNAAGYYGTGKKMGIEPRYILVPRALKAQAEALFIPRWASTVEAAIASKGGPTYGGLVEPVTVPEWTDATDYAAVVDPALVPGIMIGEIFGVKPQIFSAASEIDPAMFANDESRIKVRQFLTVGVADFRPLHKSNVGG